ncbi:universal stress protein [Dyadobacter arcticus]|uniref:UspA domain-containing protein n=1 Tax=Dyadobacter arcticus TaxID=1078754 RepID=A0ABX0UJ83_9BACT|nr:universal stress protein [Dyadobacter arcticus]NIJ52558.1 hypothetical protein [Dyadobacter arcticus]
MKNILLAINPDKPGLPCLQFGCYLAQLTQSRLTAVFLENRQADPTPSLEIRYSMPYVETIVDSDLPNYAEHEETRSIYIEIFKKICEDRGVRYNIHQDLNSPLEGIIAESRFADVLLISRDISFEDQSVDVPSGFVKNILAKTECPIIAAPITFDEVDEILFAFDDSRSSAFALKQFSYLFPELEDLKLTMLHVRKDEDEDELRTEKLSQWVSNHYNYPVFKVVTGNPVPELFKYLSDKKRTFVIMGSYGRSSLSTMLDPSTADSLLENLDLPFFFTHN